MGVNIRDLIPSSMETITIFDINTGAYRCTLEELQDFSISQSQDKTDVTGKNGRKLASIKRNKSITISGTNGVISGGLMELQTGAEFENGTTTVRWTDYLTVTSDSATTTYTAVGTDGAEIVELWTKNSDGTLNAQLTQGSTAASGVFTYDPDTKALTFSGVDDDTDIIVYYDRTITADYLENYSDTYSEVATMYVDMFYQDTCDNMYYVQYYIPKADISGEFSTEISDSQTVHSFEAEALAGACGTDGLYYKYTIFGVNTEDAA